MVLAAWTSERLTFHGKYWDFDDVEVLPKPVQQPHPPTWVAATSTDAVSWAASMGHAILMDPHASFAEIAAKYDHYRADLAAERLRRRRATRRWPACVAVAATDEEAERVARAGAAWTIGAYAHDAAASGCVGGRRRRRRSHRGLRQRPHRVGLTGPGARRAGPADARRCACTTS